MSAFVQLFGAKLRKGAETLDTEAALDLQSGKKAVAIYFSAHWCPPCRGFTPKLAEWYKKDLQAAGLEVVFASSDRGEKEYEEYYKDMPWLALPFDEKDKKAALSKKFKVQGIPSVVILDTDGNTITLDGRSEVTSDPTGAKLPWTPKPLKEILGTEFLGKDGKKLGVEAIQGKNLGIYFSGHWCPPCRNFTPKFAAVYNKLKEQGNKDFEVLFVSSDRDEESFKEYYGEMPWLALPYELRDQKNALSKHFECSGIPKLVMLDQDLQIINANAVSSVRSDEAGTQYPWAPSAVKAVESEPDNIEDAPSVVILMEKLEKSKQESIVSNVLKPLAESYLSNAKAKSEDDPEFYFFTACAEGGAVATQLRALTKQETVEEGKAKMVLLDIPDNGGYYVSACEEITTASVKQFLDEYKNKKLERQQMA